MTQVDVLKIYRYAGLWIHIRKIGPDIVEYVIPFKGRLYLQLFPLDGLQHKAKMQEIGGATLLVCQAAEGAVDAIHKKHWYRPMSAVYNLINNLKVENQSNTHESKNNEDK